MSAWAVSANDPPPPPPAWVKILIAAEKWGNTPWDIVGESGMAARLKWLMRFDQYQHWINVAMKKADDERMRKIKHGR